jgi:3beta-hydroxy-delta5-steroid dehydrogenase/steroid delta-isomerase
VERRSLDNYFSIAKAQRDLGHQPLFTTKQAMADCLPYYVDLFDQMRGETTSAHVVSAITEEPAVG